MTFEEEFEYGDIDDILHELNDTDEETDAQQQPDGPWSLPPPEPSSDTHDPPSPEPSSDNQDPPTYVQVIQQLIENGDQQIESLQDSVKEYMMRIAHLKFDQALPQREEVWPAIRDMREAYQRSDCLAAIRCTAREVHRLISLTDEVAYCRLLENEFRWALKRVGWRYSGQLPEPCRFVN